MDSTPLLRQAAAWPLFPQLVGLAAIVGAQQGDPATASALALIATESAGLAKAIDELSQQRASRKTKRVEEVIRLAAANAAQNAEPAPANIDLAAEVLGAALADDDDQKTPFYGWLLSLAIDPAPNRARLVILIQAVRTLTYVELYALAHEVDTSRVPAGVLESAGLSREAYGTRTHNAALRDRPPSGVAVGSIGRLASLLVSGVKTESLRPPSGMRP